MCLKVWNPHSIKASYQVSYIVYVPKIRVADKTERCKNKPFVASPHACLLPPALAVPRIYTKKQLSLVTFLRICEHFHMHESHKKKYKKKYIKSLNIHFPFWIQSYP